MVMSLMSGAVSYYDSIDKYPDSLVEMQDTIWIDIESPTTSELKQLQKVQLKRVIHRPCHSRL
jgi:Mg2+ and Co2+ transporter CorA